MKILFTTIFIVAPYATLYLQSILIAMAEDPFAYSMAYRHMIYLLAGIILYFFMYIMDKMETKEKLILEGCHLLLLLFFLFHGFLNINLGISPITSFYAYTFSAIMGILYIGILLMDFMVSLYRYIKNK